MSTDVNKYNTALKLDLAAVFGMSRKMWKCEQNDIVVDFMIKDV